MRAGASKSDADSSCSLHPAIKSFLIRMLLVICNTYIYMCFIFFPKAAQYFLLLPRQPSEIKGRGCSNRWCPHQDYARDDTGWDLRSAGHTLGTRMLCYEGSLCGASKARKGLYRRDMGLFVGVKGKLAPGSKVGQSFWNSATRVKPWEQNSTLGLQRGWWETQKHTL